MFIAQLKQKEFSQAMKIIDLFNAKKIPQHFYCEWIMWLSIPKKTFKLSWARHRQCKNDHYSSL